MDLENIEEPSEIKDLERYRLKLSFWKYVIGILLGTTLTAILGHLIKDREITLRELESASAMRLEEQANLRNYFTYTMEGNAYDRLKLSLFFSTVLEDTSARRRWGSYHNSIENELEEWARYSYKVDSIEAALRDSSIPHSKLDYELLYEKAERLNQLLTPVDNIIIEDNRTVQSAPSNSAGVQPINSNQTNQQKSIAYLRLERYLSDNDATLGKLYLVNATDGKDEFLCYTLEDEYRTVKLRGETRIPAGSYLIGMRTVGGFHSRYQKKYGEMHRGMLHIQDVPGFEYILITSGNTDEHTMGAILVGATRSEDVGDFKLGASVSAYKKVYPIISDAIDRQGNIEIEIVDNDNPKDYSNPS